MTPAQREKLSKVAIIVGARQRDNVPAADIIAEMVRDHGATHAPRWDGNKLRCAGVTASCTWSADKGLLDNWVKTATVRLMQQPELLPADADPMPRAGLAWD